MFSLVRTNVRSGWNVQVASDLFNYATNADLNRAAGIDASALASKTDLASIKTNIDDLDEDELKIAPAE